MCFMIPQQNKDRNYILSYTRLLQEAEVYILKGAKRC